MMERYKINEECTNGRNIHVIPLGNLIEVENLSKQEMAASAFGGAGINGQHLLNRINHYGKRILEEAGLSIVG